MNKPFGIRGAIIPNTVCKNINKTYSIDEIDIQIKDDIFEVGYDTQSDETKARHIAQNMINSWQLRNGIKISVDFNQSWKMESSGSKTIGINLSDSTTASDRVMMVTTTTHIIKGMAYIIKKESDSFSFDDDVKMAEKALKDQPLSEALEYFGSEVVQGQRPLYGIHKAIELLMKHLGNGNEHKGRRKLATLAGKTETYISELTETAQTQRHSSIWLTTQGVKKILNEVECKERAKTLIEAYSKTI